MIDTRPPQHPAERPEWHRIRVGSRRTSSPEPVSNESRWCRL